MRVVPCRLSLLDGANCEHLYGRALDILAVKGFRVDSPGMVRRLARCGGRVSGAGGVVTLPPALVREAVAAAPAEFDVVDLDGTPIRVARGSAVDWVGTYVEAVRWLDYGARRLRPATLEDLSRAVRLADALPPVRRTGAIVWPLDLPVEEQLPAVLKTVLTTTRKNLGFGLQNACAARRVLEAVAVAAPGVDMGRQHVLTFAASPTSPSFLT